MGNRDATATIKGYFYQFDHYIMKLLTSSEEEALVYSEKIEDIDIVNVDETKAIQCKYYEATDYNHSVIKKAIIFMFKHYISNKDKNIQYHIYGHYRGGQEKLPEDFDVEFLKENFLTHIKSKKKIEEYILLNASDEDLDEFLNRLNIDINGLSLDEQNKAILTIIKKEFNCKDSEAEHFYNNSLKLVKDISIKSNSEDRGITKKEFLNKINNKKTLFNEWYLSMRGKENFHRMMKKKYFSDYNLSPFTRIILIECDGYIEELEIKKVLTTISNKFSKITKRHNKPFCPYVYLHNLSKDKLLNVKRMLQSDSIKFVDGHNYRDAEFDLESILIEPNSNNQIRLKIINEKDQIDLILKESRNRRIIFQFYIKEVFYKNKEHEHNIIPITSVEDINNII